MTQKLIELCWNLYYCRYYFTANFFMTSNNLRYNFIETKNEKKMNWKGNFMSYWNVTRVILLLLTTNYRLDMCRRQYANDACNRGTAGNHCKNQAWTFKQIFFKNFKINKLASLLIPYCCFFVSLCLSICIIVSSLCKKKIHSNFSLLFHHTSTSLFISLSFNSRNISGC